MATDEPLDESLMDVAASSPALTQVSVRMLQATAKSAAVQQRLGGSSISCEPYVVGSQVQPADYLKIFTGWANRSQLPNQYWASMFIHLIQDIDFREELSSLPVPESDSSTFGDLESHWLECTRLFLRKYALTSAELRVHAQHFLEIIKGATEPLQDFLSRFSSQHKRGHPGEPIHSLYVFRLFIRALDDDVKRRAASWRFYSSRDAARVSEPEVNEQPIYSWEQLCQVTRAAYENRSPYDIADSQRRGVRKHMNAQRNQGEYRETHVSEAAVSRLTTQQALMTAVDRPFDGYATPAPTDAALLAFSLRAQMPAHAQPAHAANAGGSHATSVYAGVHPPRSSIDRNRAPTKRTVRAVQAAQPEPAPPAKRGRGTARGGVADRPSSQRGGYSAGHAAGPPPRSLSDRPAPSGRGPCADCCMPHDWTDCVRNQESVRANPAAFMHRNSGPHFRSLVADQETVTRLYGRVGVLPGTTPMKRDPNGASVRMVSLHARGASPPPLEPASSSADEADEYDFDAEDSLQRRHDEALVHLVRVGAGGSREILIKGVLGGVQVAGMLVDTGSHISLVTLAFFESHRDALGPLLACPPYIVTVADGGKADIRGTIRVPVTIYDPARRLAFTRVCDFVVINTLNVEVLAGMDLMSRFFKTIDVQNGRCGFRQDLRADPTHSLGPAPSTQSPLRLSKGVILPPYSCRDVRVYYRADFHAVEGVPVLVEPIELHNKAGELMLLDFPAHLRGGAEQMDAQGEYSMLVRNTSTRTLNLPADLQLGYATLTSEVAGRLRLTGALAAVASPALRVNAVRTSRVSAAASGAVSLATPSPAAAPMEEDSTAVAAAQASGSASSSVNLPSIPIPMPAELQPDFRPIHVVERRLVPNRQGRIPTEQQSADWLSVQYAQGRDVESRPLPGAGYYNLRPDQVANGQVAAALAHRYTCAYGLHPFSPVRDLPGESLQTRVVISVPAGSYSDFLAADRAETYRALHASPAAAHTEPWVVAMFEAHDDLRIATLDWSESNLRGEEVEEPIRARYHALEAHWHNTYLCSYPGELSEAFGRHGPVGAEIIMDCMEPLNFTSTSQYLSVEPIQALDPHVVGLSLFSKVVGAVTASPAAAASVGSTSARAAPVSSPPHASASAHLPVSQAARMMDIDAAIDAATHASPTHPHGLIYVPPLTLESRLDSVWLPNGDSRVIEYGYQLLERTLLASRSRAQQEQL